MNHKLLKASLAGAAVIALAAGGSTYAAWSDFGQVNGNKTDAGHLVLTLNGSGTITNVGGQSIAPGEARTIDQYVTSADLDGVPSADLSVTFQNLKDLENGCSSNSENLAEAGACAGQNDAGEFSQQAYVRIRWSDPAAGITFSNNNCQLPAGATLNHSYNYSPPSDNNSEHYPTLQDVVNAGAIPLGTLNAGQGVCIRFDVGLPKSADDKTQGDSSTWDMQYDLKQHFA